MVMLSQEPKTRDNRFTRASAWVSPLRTPGVLLRAGADPVLYLDNPPGVKRPQRRGQLNDLARLNQALQSKPGTLRPSQEYKPMRCPSNAGQRPRTYRSEHGTRFHLRSLRTRIPQTRTHAANCLMARRLVERGVRCVQLRIEGGTSTSLFLPSYPGSVRPTNPPPHWCSTWRKEVYWMKHW